MPGKLYDIADLLDKELYAIAKVSLYTFYPENKNYFAYAIAPGKRVGKIYSYIIYGNNELYWQLYEKYNNKVLYVKHKEGIFDEKILAEQGVIDIETKRKEKEEENKDWSEKLLSMLKPAFFIVVGAYVVVSLGKTLITKKNK